MEEQSKLKFAWHLVVPIVLALVIAGIPLISLYSAYQDLRDLRVEVATTKQYTLNIDKWIGDNLIKPAQQQAAQSAPQATPVIQPEPTKK